MVISFCLETNSKRIEKYESVYEPIDNDELSYVKLINMQSKVICNRIYGNMAHMLVPFLMSVHVMYVLLCETGFLSTQWKLTLTVVASERPIYLCRPAHFETDGDSQSYRELHSLLDGKSTAKLSELGDRFVHCLKEVLQNEVSSIDASDTVRSLKHFRVYTRYSMHRRLPGGNVSLTVLRVDAFVRN